MEVTVYELVVKGRLGERYRVAFEGMALVDDGENTVIRGPVTDRSHLGGLLDRIDDLGLVLVRMGPAAEDAAGPDRRTPAPHRTEWSPDGR